MVRIRFAVGCIESRDKLETILNVENLKVHFPVKKGFLSRVQEHVRAVDGVSLAVQRGETLGLVGESGCGKTTLGLAVLRLIEPTDGKIVFQDKDMAELSKSELQSIRKEMQIIFQDPYSSLNPRMTVNRILSDPMKIHNLYQGREIQDRVAYLLEKVGLSPEQGERYPHQFSGGQRQRIGVARALALNPRMIIGDEPVSALDVSIQAQIINLLIDLQEEFQLSYMIISHDLAVVEYICDRIAVMYLGKIVESSSYRELYSNPKHPYTQALLSAVPTADLETRKERIILTGDVPSPINPPTGCRFHPRCPKRMDGCDQTEPQLNFAGIGHLVAFFLFD